MSAIIESDLNPDAPEFTMERTIESKGQPKLFQPARFEYHERSESQQPPTMVRNADGMPEQQPTYSQVVREGNPDSPTENANYRDRMDSLYSNDSLINLSPEELAQREREIFGDHYWRQQQQQDQQRMMMPEGQVEENFPPLQPVDSQLIQDNQMPQSLLRDAESRIPSFIPPECPVSPRRPIGQFIRDLVLWRNIKDSAVIFCMGSFLLFALSYFSFISVMAYSALSVLLLASGVVFGKQLMYALQQKQSAHPFERVLQQEVIFTPEYAHQQLDGALMPLNRCLVRMRNLFLADSLGQTLKLALAMYLMTYLGAWFNLLTLVMVVWVSAFSIPPLYVMYRPQLDRVFRMMRDNMRRASLKVRAMIRRGSNKLAGKVEQIQAGNESKNGSVKVQKKVTIEKREKIQ